VLAEIEVANRSAPATERDSVVNSVAAELFGLSYRELSDPERQLVRECAAQVALAGGHLARVAPPVKFRAEDSEGRSAIVAQIDVDPPITPGLPA
jgi:hypothetical protein